MNIELTKQELEASIASLEQRVKASEERVEHLQQFADDPECSDYIRQDIAEEYSYQNILNRKINVLYDKMHRI